MATAKKGLQILNLKVHKKYIYFKKKYPFFKCQFTRKIQNKVANTLIFSPRFYCNQYLYYSYKMHML